MPIIRLGVFETRFKTFQENSLFKDLALVVKILLEPWVRDIKSVTNRANTQQLLLSNPHTQILYAGDATITASNKAYCSGADVHGMHEMTGKHWM